jgi:hypothetical protein
MQEEEISSSEEEFEKLRNKKVLVDKKKYLNDLNDNLEYLYEQKRIKEIQKEELEQ